jgi:hypothetical protein
VPSKLSGSAVFVLRSSWRVCSLSGFVALNDPRDQSANHLTDGNAFIVGHLLQKSPLVARHPNKRSSILAHNHLPSSKAQKKAWSLDHACRADSRLLMQRYHTSLSTASYSPYINLT